MMMGTHTVYAIADTPRLPPNQLILHVVHNLHFLPIIFMEFHYNNIWLVFLGIYIIIYAGADSRRASSQCEASSQSNAVSHWLGANLD